MALTNVWKVSAVGQGPAGEAIVNTFHYGFDGVEPDQDAYDFADQWAANNWVFLLAVVTADYTCYQVEAIAVLGHNLGKSGNSTNGAGNVGTLAGASAPLQCAAVAQRRGNAATRHNRGRTFISPFPASYMDVDGDLTPGGTFAPDVVTLVKQNLTVGATLYQPCLWDVIHNQAILITNGQLGAQVAVQRRRRLRLPN